MRVLKTTTILALSILTGPLAAETAPPLDLEMRLDPATGGK